MVALVAAIVRLAMDESGALDALQFVLAAIFLTYVVLLLDSARGRSVPRRVRQRLRGRRRCSRRHAG